VRMTPRLRWHDNNILILFPVYNTQKKYEYIRRKSGSQAPHGTKETTMMVGQET
jgi:hypothetical protein